ncbi:MAG TPA: ComEC/Rec2 family competence protein [Solirubrobacterales bacterium]|nr:ComEC/Rec2 family competence protein [Solirubrobacterales bacterium]
MSRAQLAGPLLLLGVGLIALLAAGRAPEIRDRASAALDDGMPAREAALARGFVLGQDEGVDAATEEDFRRSGLAHLLAVSGQNVALLALLAMPLLAAFGLPLRARLVWVLGLILVYVPLAGAGPSIQRAGIMGALNVVALLAGRRASRFYGLAVAALVTLAVDPGIGADVGWQLSFAALLGILVLAAPLRRLLPWRVSGAVGRALSDAAAMTVAATVATAPLIAFHFGELSTTSLAANLLAAPAVAPAMWLGMVVAAAAQAPGFPVELLNAVNALLLAYIAQVAAWCAGPSWASVEVGLGAGGLAVSYALIALAAIAIRLRVRADGAHTSPYRRRSAAWRGALGIALVTAAVALPWPAGGGDGTPGPLRGGLRVSVLDVGQGDAILLQPAAAEPVLVDTGPPGAGLVAELRAAGVERLGAVVLTHDQSDHSGGLADLLGAVPVERVVYASLGPPTLGIAERVHSVHRVAAGSRLRSGPMSFDVLWPPRTTPATLPLGEDPNRTSLVLLLRWRDFTMLLSADAEAGSTPLDPGPLDVLKLAHHGSEDTGLGELLARTQPRAAVISVGDDNPFGHPTGSALSALARHGVVTWRTDRDGTVAIEVRPGSFQITGSEG